MKKKGYDIRNKRGERTTDARVEPVLRNGEELISETVSKQTRMKGNTMRCAIDKVREVCPWCQRPRDVPRGRWICGTCADDVFWDVDKCFDARSVFRGSSSVSGDRRVYRGIVECIGGVVGRIGISELCRRIVRVAKMVGYVSGDPVVVSAYIRD